MIMTVGCAATLPPANPPVPEPPHVDFKMNDFTAAGMQRLTSLPVGWEVGFDTEKGEIYLKIDGKPGYERSKPGNFKPGICYRFLEENLIACPAAPPPAS